MFIIFIGLEKLRLPGPYRPGKGDNPFWGNWSISVTFGYVKGFRLRGSNRLSKIGDRPLVRNRLPLRARPGAMCLNKATKSIA